MQGAQAPLLIQFSLDVAFVCRCGELSLIH